MRFKKTATLTVLLLALLSAGCALYHQSKFKTTDSMRSPKKTIVSKKTTYFYDKPEPKKQEKKEIKNYKIEYEGYIDTLMSAGEQKVIYFVINPNTPKKYYIMRIIGNGYTYSMIDSDGNEKIEQGKDIILRKEGGKFIEMKPENPFRHFTLAEIIHIDALKKIKIEQYFSYTNEK